MPELTTIAIATYNSFSPAVKTDLNIYYTAGAASCTLKTGLTSTLKTTLLDILNPTTYLKTELAQLSSKQTELADLQSALAASDWTISKDEFVYGEMDEEGEITGEEFKEYKAKIKEAGMPPDVKERAEKELKRLSEMSPNNPEGGYIRNYLDWLCDMPWSQVTPNNVPMKKAAKILEDEHYGIEKAKESILEFLAVMKLKKSRKDPKDGQPRLIPQSFALLVLRESEKLQSARSIAKALNRKFVRVSLGGIRDEAEIRGHRRTYVGAMPGRIIQGVKNAGTKNPVFMLDEIDKIGIDFRGDPSSALLEALDPEQNKEFSDHYLEVPFDLSEVMFICTGNVLDTIPAPLRDRMEVITFPGLYRDRKVPYCQEIPLAKTA